MSGFIEGDDRQRVTLLLCCSHLSGNPATNTNAPVFQSPIEIGAPGQC